MNELRYCMSYADLLAWTQSDGANNRIQALGLPRDPTLQERYAVVFTGPNAADLMQMVLDALDAYFTREVAAQPQVLESHGSESRAQSSD